MRVAGEVAVGDGGLARWRFTDRGAGDLGHRSGPGLEARRAAAAPVPWTWLRQVHGTNVVTVDRPGGRAGALVDAAVTAAPGAVLSVQTADCAPVLIWSTAGRPVVAAVHAGWRGAAGGILTRAVTLLARHGGRAPEARLGPCIHPSAYEFGPADLDAIARVLGPEIRSETAAGRPALDLPRAIRIALDRCGVPLHDDTAVCTAASGTHFSHRARRDSGRQVGLIWIER